jgi:hypothetical protein
MQRACSKSVAARPRRQLHQKGVQPCKRRRRSRLDAVPQKPPRGGERGGQCRASRPRGYFWVSKRKADDY